MLQKVQPNTNIVLSASAWNAFIDATNKINTINGKFQQKSDSTIAPFYKCVSNQQLKYGMAVVIDTMANDYLQSNVDGSDIILSYVTNNTLMVRPCAKKDGFGQIGVIQKDNKDLGSDQYSGTKMIVSGPAVVRFAAGKLNASHKRCYCGDNGLMQSANVGSHKIIKVLSDDTDGSDNQFALVHINCGLKDSLRCRITASEQLSTRKWLYSWEQIKRNGNSFSGSVSGAMSNTSWAKAINGSQSNNTSGATLQSSGYNFNQQPFLTNTQLDITQIRGQPIVNIYFSIDQTDGTKYADFDMLNIISGNCGEA